MIRIVPLGAGLLVALILYAIGGGNYPLPVDLCVVGSLGLMAYAMTRQALEPPADKPADDHQP